MVQSPTTVENLIMAEIAPEIMYLRSQKDSLLTGIENLDVFFEKIAQIVENIKSQVTGQNNIVDVRKRVFDELTTIEKLLVVAILARNWQGWSSGAKYDFLPYRCGQLQGRVWQGKEDILCCWEDGRANFSDLMLNLFCHRSLSMAK